MPNRVENMDVIRLTACQIHAADSPDWLDDSAAPRSGDTIVVATWMSPGTISRIGLPKAGICGFLTEPVKDIDPGIFIEYEEFIELIHNICINHIDPRLINYAIENSSDSIAVIDQRSVDVNAEIPTEDIIGTYEIEHGSVKSFSPNPNFRLFTSNGCFQLNPWLRNRLLSLVLPANLTE
ncbi:hypothetical protein [Paludisphaera rhizosphaerae]|uniref:hypothetical protein n=1 Tax=Paludisphaera rhizosphaerae TaxID=2711216 RepID=UPI0013EA5E66|nr:hypothetical protein [Paludisphaera rhizosphaerae]